MPLWVWITLYVAGFVFTGGLNLAMIVGPANPLAVLRNALLWPIMLPVLLILAYLETRG